MISIKSIESECQNQRTNCYEEVHCQGTGINGRAKIRSRTPLIPGKKDVFLKMIYIRNATRELKKIFAIVLVSCSFYLRWLEKSYRDKKGGIDSFDVQHSKIKPFGISKSDIPTGYSKTYFWVPTGSPE